MVHEWALSEAIISYIEEHHRGKKVLEISLGLGELQNIDEEILIFSLRELLKSKNMGDPKISVRRIPITLRCRSCGYTWSPNMSELSEELLEVFHFVPETIHSYLRCPRCGSRDYEIVAGRGVYIEKLVIE